jgi:hypothetical protein
MHTHTHIATYIISHDNYKLHKTAPVTSYSFDGPHEQHTRLHAATSSLLKFTHIIRLLLIKAKRVSRKHINSLQATSMKLSKAHLEKDWQVVTFTKKKNQKEQTELYLHTTQPKILHTLNTF